MSPMRTPMSRRLVLARETLRALTESGPRPAMTVQPQEMSSCGEKCACTDQVLSY